MRGREGGSRRGQRGAGGSAPPPPDSLPRKPEKVLQRVLCQAPRRHRAAGHPPSPSGSRRGRPGTGDSSPTLPTSIASPTRSDGSCGASGWHLVVQEGCVLGGQSPRGGGMPFCSPSARGHSGKRGEQQSQSLESIRASTKGSCRWRGCRMGKGGGYWGTLRKSSSTEPR